eukprot:gb/GFBE01081707.1/.p1 GENE.gb/GFBE01081707.1/~~gb/GFBE01081707.1/.p1  ORF type:complete len:145 (+),score=34.27 gb/GFBE01081707.1/:1-435(+)
MSLFSGGKRPWQCPHWGTSAFDGCKFCRRSRATPGLKFKSDRHTECNSCTARLNREPDLKKKHGATWRQKKADILKEDDGEYGKWVGDIEQIEEHPSKRQRRTNNEACDQEVVELAGRQFEARTLHGVLWPLADYEAETGKSAN